MRKIADLLRGPYQPNQYGDVIMPFTILRRLDCILEPTKDEVLAEHKKARSQKIDPAVVLKSKLKLPFFNTSQWTFAKLVSDPEGVADNLVVRLPIAPCAAARCHHEYQEAQRGDHHGRNLGPRVQLRPPRSKSVVRSHG
ncbi:MAG TPA: type I restriction-modification system subunit M N-terminal domain-containing protein [Mycobacterium sp.]|nr:type I restriction-modification system subunit M N-terminal domain-containing protein [Mycobacterium sp.]